MMHSFRLYNFLLAIQTFVIGNHSLSAFNVPVEGALGSTILLNVQRHVKGSDVFIEPIDSEMNHRLSESKEQGLDSGREYILLEKGEYSNQCSKDFKMSRLGIEKISFQVYQLAEAKFFDMDFNISVSGGRAVCLHFSNRDVSAGSSTEFFQEVENVANAVGAFGLATLANQAIVLASGSQLPPGKDSPYFRCMAGCDRVEFEPFKLLCYLACTIWADDTPGT